MTDNSIYSPNGGTNYNFYRWDEPTNYWIIFGSTGSPAAFTDTEFVAAKGYGLTRSAHGVLTFTGTLRTDDVSYTATYNAGTGVGFNIVGNPFTSSIGITNSATTTGKFLATNTALLHDSYEAVYIWDEQASYVDDRNDYKVISNAAILGYTSISQDYIQPGQAFMVKVVSGGGSLAFNENMQAHANDNFYKSTTEVWPSVELMVSSDSLFNSTAIGFNDNMTLGLDPSYDVGKMKGNPNIALYTRLVQDNGVDFAIQALPDNDIESLVIPVGIDVTESIMCEFSVNPDVLEGYPIYLEDTKENTVTNLKEHSYNTLVTESGTGRFFLHFREVSGIDDIENINNIIQIWASNHTINIHNNNNYIGDIKVVNMYGQIVLTTKLDGNQTQQFRVDAPSGYYIINTITKKGVVNKKVYLR
jgi:hypothetical protein